MKTTIAILVATFFLAVCYWLSRPRYEFHLGTNSAIIWRCDRLTGTVCWAVPSVQNPSWHFIETAPTWAETSAINMHGSETVGHSTNADGLEIVTPGTRTDTQK